MARSVIAADPFGSFLGGRQARQDEEYANTRNALAREDLANAPRRNRLADLQLQSMERQFSQEQVQQALQQTAAAASRLAQSQDPRREAAMHPEFIAKLREQHPEIDQMDDDGLREYFGFVAGQAQAKLGIGPSAPETFTLKPGETRYSGGRAVASQPASDSGFALSPGQTRFDATGRPIASVAPAPEKPAGQFRALTPEEVQQAGLPPGTSAQVGPDGKIDVLSKRDNTGVLSQKDATTAKQKLTTIQLAKKQIADIKAAFQTGTQGANAFGPVQGYMPTQQGKKFDAAVDRMRSTLTALTRVPGVGAMSDYETKLDQAKFPSRKAYESVTAEQIQGIEDMLALIENGYTSLLSGGGQQQSPASAAAPDINALLDKYAPQ